MRPIFSGVKFFVSVARLGDSTGAEAFVGSPSFGLQSSPFQSQTPADEASSTRQTVDFQFMCVTRFEVQIAKPQAARS